MNAPSSRVTVHMAMSLDGYIARRDGGVDWMAVQDEFPTGASLSAEEIAAFLQGIAGTAIEVDQAAFKLFFFEANENLTSHQSVGSVRDYGLAQSGLVS